MTRRDPINQTDEDARSLARRLLDQAGFGALATTDPEGGPAPLVSRVAVTGTNGAALILVSELALHTKGLNVDPACSILLGEPGDKGDPLVHPRMTLVARATEVDKGEYRTLWLSRHPKAQLYFDFADFRMLRLVPQVIHLNGGFGKAYRLTPEDLIKP